MGWLGERAYVLDMPQDASLHHEGVIGSILAVMFGYTIKAEWARAFPLVFWVYKEDEKEKIGRIYKQGATHDNFENIERLF